MAKQSLESLIQSVRSAIGATPPEEGGPTHALVPLARGQGEQLTRDPQLGAQTPQPQIPVAQGGANPQPQAIPSSPSSQNILQGGSMPSQNGQPIRLSPLSYHPAVGLHLKVLP